MSKSKAYKLPEGWLCLPILDNKGLPKYSNVDKVLKGQIQGIEKQDYNSVVSQGFGLLQKYIGSAMAVTKKIMSIPSGDHIEYRVGRSTFKLNRKDVTRMRDRLLDACKRLKGYIRSSRRVPRPTNPEDFKSHYKRLLWGEPMLELLKSKNEFPANGVAGRGGSVADHSQLMVDGMMLKSTAMDLLFMSIYWQRYRHYQANPLPSEDEARAEFAAMRTEQEVADYAAQFSHKFFTPSPGMKKAFDGEVPSLYVYDGSGAKVLNDGDQNVFEAIATKDREFDPESPAQYQITRIISLISYSDETIRDAIDRADAGTGTEADGQIADLYANLMDKANEKTLLADMRAVKAATRALKADLADVTDRAKKLGNLKSAALKRINK